MSIETKCLASQACLAPVSQLFLKPLLCSAKANVQRIQQETFPVLLLPLSQLLLEFKGSAHKGWARALSTFLSSELSYLKFTMKKKKKNPEPPKTTLSLLLLLPSKHLHVEKTDSIHFPGRG